MPVSQSYGILLNLIPLIAAIILLISVMGAFVCSRYFSGPLIRICSVARRMTGLDMTWKCEEKRSDEIGVLAASLNEMSDRLTEALDSLQSANVKLQQDIEKERKQEKQRIDFFTAVSHELKTPIAIMKGELEGMICQVGEYRDRDRYLRHCMKTVNDMEEIVKEILFAARMGGSDFQVIRSDLNISRMLPEKLSEDRGPDRGQTDAAAYGDRAGFSLRGRRAAAGQGLFQCTWKCCGLFRGGGCNHSVPEKGRLLC